MKKQFHLISKQLNYLIKLNLLVFCIVFVSHTGKAKSTSKIDSIVQQIDHSNDSIKTVLLFELVQLFSDSDLALSFDYARKVLPISKKLSNKKLEARAFKAIGKLHYLNSNFDSAFFYYQKTLKIIREIGVPQDVVAMHISLGNLYYRKSEYDMALNCFQAALEESEAGNFHKYDSRILNNIGITYLKLNQYKLAKSYFFKIISLGEQYTTNTSLATTYNSLGDLYRLTGKNDSAIFYFEKTLAIDLATNYKRGLSGDYNNLGIVYKNIKEFDKALGYHKKSLSIDSSLQNWFGVAASFNNIGNIYKNKENNKKAIDFFLKSIDVSKKHNLKDVKLDAFKNVTEAFKSSNDFKMAFYYQEKSINLKDSLFNEDNQNAIKSLEQTINKLERQQRLKNKELAIQKEREFRNIFIFIIIISSIFIILIIYRHFSIQKTKSKFQLIELQNKALHLQMNPHFIFNSLGAISSFITQNQKTDAVKYLAKFAKLMRLTLEVSKKPKNTIEEEIQILKNYLTLEQIRFSNKFNYHIEAEPGLDLNKKIPSMFIQPFVENAVNHGVVPKLGKGNISVKFYTKAKFIICEITDDGIGRKLAKEKSKNKKNKHLSSSMAINTRRLKNMNYVNNQKNKLSIIDLRDGNGNPKGTKVIIQFSVND